MLRLLWHTRSPKPRAVSRTRQKTPNLATIAVEPSGLRGSQAKKFLFVALNYAPEIVGCGKYTSDLAEDLVRRGHHVEVVCASPYYPQWRTASAYAGRGWFREVINGVIVHRAPIYVPKKPTGVKRSLHVASFGFAAIPPAAAVALRLKPDLVFTVAPTLAAVGAAWFAGKISGAKTWLHVQDFEVDAAFDLGFLRNPQARRTALNLERRLLSIFDHVSSISPAMVGLLQRKGLPGNRVSELRNWADIDAISVLASSNTSYRRELGIPAGEIVALYSGNMAAKQSIESLAEVAARLKAAGAPVTLLLCGEGPAREALQQACAAADNVRFLPLQPLERLAELLGTADIHLLPQKAAAADLVLPSKLTGMLASGRPVVAMAKPGSGLAAEVEGCGALVEPTAAAMAEAVLTLAADPTARQVLGAAGRQRAESRWCKKAIIGRFEAAVG